MPERELAVRAKAVGRDHLVRKLHLQMTGREPAEVQFLTVTDEPDRREREDDVPDLLCFGIINAVEGIAGKKEREDRALRF